MNRRPTVALLGVALAALSIVGAGASMSFEMTRAHDHAAVLPVAPDAPAVIADAGARSAPVAGLTPVFGLCIAVLFLALACTRRSVAPTSLLMLVGAFGFSRRRRAPPLTRS